jgi:hypothetical protein
MCRFARDKEQSVGAPAAGACIDVLPVRRCGRHAAKVREGVAVVRLTATATAIVCLLFAATAFAATVTGRTTEGTHVTATVTNGKVTFITMEVRARCTNGHSVTEGPGFAAPFAHPQNHADHFGDSYANLAGTMRLAGQRLSASFTATIHNGKIVGTVNASSLVVASGVRCSSGPVAFHVP